jgi:hypothetical protein
LTTRASQCLTTAPSVHQHVLGMMFYMILSVLNEMLC